MSIIGWRRALAKGLHMVEDNGDGTGSLQTIAGGAGGDLIGWRRAMALGLRVVQDNGDGTGALLTTPQAGSADVSSFNGRTGAVIPLTDDYTAAQIGGLTEGSVLFADANGRIAEDNAHFFYDDAANRLIITGSLRVNVSTAEDLAIVGNPGAGETVFKLHHTGTNLGNYTAYFKHDGGGGAITFQRTVAGPTIINIGAVGAMGALTGSATLQDDIGLMGFATQAGGTMSGGLHFLPAAVEEWRMEPGGRLRGHSATANFTFRRDGVDANPRFNIDRNGVVTWGDGTAATDTQVQRFAAGQLEIDAALLIQNAGFNAYLANLGQPAIYYGATGGTYPFNFNGHLIIQPRSSADGEIVFATVATGGTTPLTRVVIPDGLDGLLLGANRATNIYSASDNLLQTDDTFNINNTGGLQVSGSKVVGARGAAVADAAGGAVVDIEARAALNALLARVRAATGHGLIG